jgi:hypothetical protein
VRAEGSSIDFLRCEFLANGAGERGLIGGWGSGGAVCCADVRAGFTECVFSDNEAVGGLMGGTGDGGAVYADGGSLVFDACVFSGNLVGGDCVSGSAVRADDARFDGCTFSGHRSITFGSSASLIGGSNLSLTGCVIFDNEGGLAFSGASSVSDCTVLGGAYGIDTGVTATVTVSRSIVAFGSGPGFQGSGTAVVGCTDAFGNAGGDFVGPAAGQGTLRGNLSRWPLFCDPAARDYQLSAGSPCAPSYNSCGVVIGALAVGCGPVSIEPMSWGRIKGTYR